jgi:hypothetical protein
MALPEIREIDDLVALYKLEPSLRDVFVEGQSDASVVEWFLKTSGIPLANVNEITFVNVPAQMVCGAGLEDNNRGRVIALANELERRLNGEGATITAIVDSDFAVLLGIDLNSCFLMGTDYACMEMYFFNEQCLAKLLMLFVRGFPIAAAQVLADISAPLQELFLIRLANHTLGWNLKIIPYEDFFTLSGENTEFDRNLYIRRLLIANGQYPRLDGFLNEIETHRRRLTGDPRNQIHGHDFVAILARYIRLHRKRHINLELLNSVLPTCTELLWLAEERLFAQLTVRLRN